MYIFHQEASNYIEVNNQGYLLYVYRYLGWVTTYYLPPGSSTSSELINVLRAKLMIMGVPEEMSCDGGTYLTSYEMKAWLKG